MCLHMKNPLCEGAGGRPGSRQNFSSRLTFIQSTLFSPSSETQRNRNNINGSVLESRVSLHVLCACSCLLSHEGLKRQTCRLAVIRLRWKSSLVTCRLDPPPLCPQLLHTIPYVSCLNMVTQQKISTLTQLVAFTVMGRSCRQYWFRTFFYSPHSLAAGVCSVSVYFSVSNCVFHCLMVKWCTFSLISLFLCCH